MGYLLGVELTVKLLLGLCLVQDLGLLMSGCHWDVWLKLIVNSGLQLLFWVLHGQSMELVLALVGEIALETGRRLVASVHVGSRISNLGRVVALGLNRSLSRLVLLLELKVVLGKLRVKLLVQMV